MQLGFTDQTLLGVTGSGKTFTMAKVIEKIQKPTLVLSHNKTLAAQLCAEFKEFFPDNAVEYFVSYYDYYQPEAYIPHTDTYIEKDSATNDEIDRLRHSATAALFERKDVIVVSSVSCIYGLGDPIDYANMQTKFTNRVFTSESVTEGHPDKMCDQISDAVLDALLEQDKMSRVACECCTTTGMVMVMGEITTEAYADIPAIVRKTVGEIGYTNPEFGFDNSTCAVLTSIHEQSADIAMCLNLNTLKLDWVQNVLDDTNCSPVLELEDGHPYVYISTSFHCGWRAPVDGIAKIPVWKIDAENGEIVWEHDYECYTADGVSGGAQGTLALGKNKLSDLIFVPVAKTPGVATGILAALDKKTGKAVWEVQTQVYSWSSPVAVYDKDGNGYLVFCNSAGYMAAPMALR